VEGNDLTRSRIASAIFIPHLRPGRDFPALAARQMGWEGVPLMCAREIDVPGSLRACVRVLLT